MNLTSYVNKLNIIIIPQRKIYGVDGTEDAPSVTGKDAPKSPWFG